MKNSGRAWLILLALVFVATLATAAWARQVGWTRLYGLKIGTKRGNFEKFVVSPLTGQTVLKVDIEGTTGGNGIKVTAQQGASGLASGAIRGAYIIANNGSSAGSGDLIGVEAKARCVNANMTSVKGIYISADGKAYDQTTLRGLEISLDGSAGGTATTAQAIAIYNNSSGAQTTSYAVDINGGTASGHKVFTRDIRLQQGELIDNATDGTIALTATTVACSAGLTVGGGYGSTGATVSTAGVGQFNGALTTDGALTADNIVCTNAATFGGGYGSTGATISTAGVGQFNGALTTDGALTADSAVIGGGYGDTGATISTAGVGQFNGALTTDGALTADSIVCTNAATFGGGYGSTGATISTAGVGQFNGAVTTDGALTADSAVVGGGYGSTGATISTAGVIQANGAITTDGALTADSAAIGGGYGSTGASISTAGVGQFNGALTTDGALTADNIVCTNAATFGGGYGSTGATIATTGVAQFNGTVTSDNASGFVASGTTTGFEASGAATDGVKVSAACTDGIEVSGGCTNAINVSASQSAGFYYVANQSVSEGAWVHGVKVELTRTANQQIASGGWYGAQFVLNQGSSGYDTPTGKVHALAAIIKGSDGRTDSDGNVARFETQSGGDVGNILYLLANTGTTIGSQLMYAVSHVNVDNGIEINVQSSATMAVGIHMLDGAGAAITTAIDIDSSSTTGIDLSGATIGTQDIKLSSGASIMTGTGSPDGSVTAAKGSLYIQSDGSVDAQLWVNEDGSQAWGYVDTT